MKSRNHSSASTANAEVVVLTEDDIPGTKLSEPFVSHKVTALHWWLLCRGIKAQTSWRKSQLVARVEQAVKEKTPVLDVDGSYLYQKYRSLAEIGKNVKRPDCPSKPLRGWRAINKDSYQNIAPLLPIVPSGLVYSYLGDHVGRSSEEGAFRALTRGYAQWASGRLEQMEVNLCHPEYCHVRCTMKASMKDATYSVYMLLGCSGRIAKILSATCECVAGTSASCIHISAVLHALSGLKQSLQLQPNMDDSFSPEEDEVPCTSLLCTWVVPKNRKGSTQKMSLAVFKKHDRDKPVKRSIAHLEDFDPRPLKFRGNVKELVPELLKKVKGEHLGISVLLDPDYVEQLQVAQQPSGVNLPNKERLKETIEAFKESLVVTEDVAREIECNTREQRLSSEWFQARRYRLTASRFGDIISRKPNTPPEKLVLSILQPTNYTSVAMKYGIENEKLALEQYVLLQHQNGHPDLLVSPSGFIVNPSFSYLGASPDAAVYDPSNTEQPFGFVEIKCPYSARETTPYDAAQSSGFCCTVNSNGDIVLKENHSYYSQIQGQMAIGDRPWCDFVIYTPRQTHIQRIHFDERYWEGVLPKLSSFYDNCLAPEIVSPCHTVGQPVRKLDT